MISRLAIISSTLNAAYRLSMLSAEIELLALLLPLRYASRLSLTTSAKQL